MLYHVVTQYAIYENIRQKGMYQCPLNIPLVPSNIAEIEVFVFRDGSVEGGVWKGEVWKAECGRGKCGRGV